MKRNFTAERPNALWVTDLTYVPTWSGVAYVCFIVDAFSRMIVGWRVASHMRTDMVLDALEMARWSRGTILEGLIAHSDAGSQFTSIRYGERLTEFGAIPSIGSIGDSFDNALAEATNSLYKTELIRGPGQGPWKNVDDVELATLAWVHWYNTERLHGYLNDVPPVRVRGGLRCPTDRPATGWNPITRASIKPSANHIEARNLALGLLADCSTKIIYAQEAGEATKTGGVLGLSSTEDEPATGIGLGRGPVADRGAFLHGATFVYCSRNGAIRHQRSHDGFDGTEGWLTSTFRSSSALS